MVGLTEDDLEVIACAKEDPRWFDHALPLDEFNRKQVFDDGGYHARYVCSMCPVFTRCFESALWPNHAKVVLNAAAGRVQADTVMWRTNGVFQAGTWWTDGHPNLKRKSGQVPLMTRYPVPLTARPPADLLEATADQGVTAYSAAPVYEELAGDATARPLPKTSDLPAPARTPASPPAEQPPAEQLAPERPRRARRTGAAPTVRLIGVLRSEARLTIAEIAATAGVPWVVVERLDPTRPGHRPRTFVSEDVAQRIAAAWTAPRRPGGAGASTGGNRQPARAG